MQRAPRTQCRHCARTALWLVFAGHSLASYGACLPLPSVELRALDHYSDADPARAVREAQAALAAAPSATASMATAQLYAILAEAHVQASEPREAKEAVGRALAALDQLPAGVDAERLRRRVLISQADAAEESGDSAGALRLLDVLIARLPAGSLERSCALNSRLEAHGEVNEPDRAAADGVESYRIAEAGHWTNARIGAAYGLASIYRRAGLSAYAEQMIDEVVAVAKDEGRENLLASAQFIRGHVLIEERKYEQAIEALTVTRDLSERLGDRVGVAAANLNLCVALVAQRKYDEAERTCAGGDAEFTKAKRIDLLAVLHAVRAEIELGQHRPAKALGLLDDVLGPALGSSPPFLRPKFYRDRASALGALGRYREASADLTQAYELEESASTAQRLQAVTVLSAMAESERLAANNQMLEQRVALQKGEIATQRTLRHVWAGFSVAAVLLAALLGYLLLASRRKDLKLRRQDAIVRTVASHAPDALVLFDRARLVRFSNRPLFGTAESLRTGEPLGRGIPPKALPVLREAIDEIFAKREPVSFSIRLTDEAGVLRHFELRGGPAVEGDKLIGAVLRSVDVTAVRQLEREVIDVSSRERQQLSGDLHEGLGQELTGVLLLARSVMSGIDRGQPAGRDVIAQIADLVAHGIESTRAIARDLSPVKTERGSLTDALGRLAGEAQARLGIEITLHSDPADIVVSDVAADHLYRIAGDAVTSAARRGGCGHVMIDLCIAGAEFELTITDDGERPTSAQLGGLGERMMAYRAHLIGGDAKVGPGPQAGTRVTVTVPVAQLTASADAE